MIEYNHKAKIRKGKAMSSTVYGTHPIAVNANRVRIPAKFRSFLGDDVIATVGADGCFLLMPECNRDTVLKNYVKANDPYMSEFKEMARVVNRLTTKLDLDTQGRITVDDNLKRICKGLVGADEITFCGMGEYIEAWPSDVYNRRYGDADGDADDFDSLIANLKAKLGKAD